MTPKLFLKSQREKSVLRHHPWIFSGAISDIHGSPRAGETVQVFSSENKFLCWAAYNASSQISARIWSWDAEETIGYSFFYEKISNALKFRNRLALNSNAIRIVYAESDGLPGLIVDKYADWIVIQFLSAGAEYWRESILDICEDLLDTSNIVERSDVDVRDLEGLDPTAALISGELPVEYLVIQENENIYYVDLLHGHKTGFYLDQRDNRAVVGDIARGKDILDCFSYTGGFSVSAMNNGARSLTSIEISRDAIRLAQQNFILNHISGENIEYVEGDIFHELRKMRDRNLSFDLVILDPPKFAPTKASVKGASRGYKDINLLAFKLLRPGGLLVTFSCSGAVSESLFQKIIADAAIDAGVEAQIIDRLHQAPDHPVSLNFPEGSYLKGFFIYKQ